MHHSASHDQSIHDRALQKFVKMCECGSVKDVSNWVHILVLRVLDEPHSSRAHNLATSSKKYREQVPVTSVSIYVMLENTWVTNMNIVPTTQCEKIAVNGA